MRFLHSCISCCSYYAANSKVHRPRLMMGTTMHAAAMHHQHQAHQQQQQHRAFAAAFIVGRVHPSTQIALFPTYRNHWEWRPMTSDAQHPLHRRRRHQRRRNLLAIADTSTTPATSNNSPHEPTITPYTINQSICPSTHATILEPLVTKHIHALPQYWKNKPTAIHNEEAFEYALEFVIRFGQQLPKESSLHSSSMRGRTKVILDSGCGTGKSSHILGERYPDCVVVGIE